VAASLGEAGDTIPGIERVAGWEENLLGFLASLARMRALAEQGPVDRFVEALRLECGLESSEAARHLGGHRLTSLDRVFRDLAAALEATAGSAAAVLSFLRRAGGSEREHREGRPRSFEPGAVHVLTIHKAKGLGFSHVYLLQTHKGTRRDSGGRTALARRGGRYEYVLFGSATPGMLDAERERLAVEECERVRLLYVATTRARHRLVVAGRRTPAPREGRAALTHTELLAGRRGHPEDLSAWMAQAMVEGVSQRADAEGAIWRFPALEPGPVGRPAAPLPGPQPSAEEVAAQETRLSALREQADLRAARRWGATASDRHPPASDLEAAGYDVDRQAAMALGTAFHRVLETIRIESPPAEWREPLTTALAEAAGNGPERERVAELLEHFFASDLPQRLHALADHVMGREVPLLVRPAEGRDEAHGFVAGAIDLLYRDPSDGRVVVADYKTDLVAGPEALAKRSAAYAGQGEVYVRAVQEALGLPEPPRFELWFLDAGHVATVPIGDADHVGALPPAR
jgi:ATP-dependent exoDNAse (exonuclease V) beta subunit